MTTYFTELLNHPARLLKERAVDSKWAGALSPIFVTCLLTTIFVLVQYFGNWLKMTQNFLELCAIIGLTYPLACLAFWIAAKILRSKVVFKQIFSTWGYSYYPTLSYLVFLLLTHLLLPTGKPLFAYQGLSIILFTILIAIFLWKVLFYFIELNVVLQLNFWQMIIASIIIGTLFIAYSVCVGYLFGFKIPIV